MSKSAKPKAVFLQRLPLRIADVLTSGTDKRGRTWYRAERREVMEERIVRTGGGIFPNHISRLPVYGRVLARTRKHEAPADRLSLLRNRTVIIDELGPKPELTPPLSLEEAIRYLVPNE
jgi:hypothetical protein